MEQYRNIIGQVRDIYKRAGIIGLIFWVLSVIIFGLLNDRVFGWGNKKLNEIFASLNSFDITINEIAILFNIIGVIAVIFSIVGIVTEIRKIQKRDKKEISTVDEVDIVVDPPSQAGDRYAKLRVHNSSGKPTECTAILSEIDIFIKNKFEKSEWKDARHVVNPDNRKLSWSDSGGEYCTIATDDYGVLNMALWKSYANIAFLFCGKEEVFAEQQYRIKVIIQDRIGKIMGQFDGYITPTRLLPGTIQYQYSQDALLVSGHDPLSR